MLYLLLRLFGLARRPMHRASTPAPDFVNDVDPALLADAELQYTNSTYPHVLAYFEQCLALPASRPSDRVRRD